MERAKIIVKGEVQMAHYRAKVKAIADDLGIVGEARNLKDGTVRIIAEGEDTKLTEFIDGLKMKEYITDVHGMDVQYEEPTGKYISFERKGGDIPDEDADMLTVMKSFDKKGEKMVGLMESMDKSLGGIDGRLESIDGKQDQMLGKQDQMLGKQDQMLGKQDQMLGKQDKTTEVLGSKIDDLSGNVIQRFDTMDVKYGRIADNMEKILEEMKEERKEYRKSIERVINTILSHKSTK